MKKKYIIGIAIVVVLIVLVAVFAGKGRSGNNAEVYAEAVGLRTVTETVSANGKIQPEINVEISSEISGEIIELHVKEGQIVKEGDLMVKINPDLYMSALNRAEASLNSAKADLASARARLIQAESSQKNAKRTFDRNKSLHEQGAISDSEFESRETDYERAEAEVNAQKEGVNAAMYRVKSSEATRKEAFDNLKRTTIYAPANGTVSALEVEKGERVVGTGQMAGTHMMDIAQMDVMEVNVEVNESDIVRVDYGDTAIIEVDAYLNEKFKGIVTEIANASIGGSSASMDQVTNFDVKIRILNTSYGHIADEGKSPFKPGMSANVDIQTKTMKDALVVPIEAVTTREDTSSSAKSYDKYRKKKDDEVEPEEAAEELDTPENYTVVFIVDGEKAKIAVVETDIQDDNYIVIKSGLELDQEIIVGPYDQVSRKLTNGAKISLTSKEDFYAKNDD